MARTKILTVCDSGPFWASIQALEELRSFDFEACVTDCLTDEHLRDPHLGLVVAYATHQTSVEEIVHLIGQCRQLRPATPIVVVSEDSAPVKLIQWLRGGASDCLSAPVDRDRLLFLFESLTINRRIGSSQSVRVDNWYRQDEMEPICHASTRTAGLIRQIQQLSSQQTSVMFVGETGTGKTRLARMLHEASNRRREPFVAVNCAAMPTTLLESELFGHRRGAFTGADTNHVGKFAHVGGGTLLLDEVDTLSLEAQAKLLRTVDDRVFEPLGSNRSEYFHGRLVVATNQDLRKCVDAGEFRADLYYRLNVVELLVSPLRDRRAEILEIAEACIERYASENDCSPRLLSPEVRRLLEDYDWPGNVRELQNVIERAMTFSQDCTVRLNDLPGYLIGARASLASTESFVRTDSANMNHLSERAAPSLARARAEGEKNRLIEVLRKHNDNRSRAAKELGISRTALYKRLNRHGLVRFSIP